MIRLVAAIAAVLVLGGPAHAAATTYIEVEREVMCVSCGVPLAAAENAQAEAQREEIRRLVAQGLSKQQVLDRLVDTYGTGVLANPRPDEGIGVTAYAIPVALLLILLGGLAVVVPRWRGLDPEASPALPALDPADAARLDAELEARR